MRNCFCKFHKTSNITATEANIVLTVTSSTNISSLDDFNLLVCKDIASVVTGEPLPVQIIVNGTAVSLLNRYSLPIYSNRLCTREPYYGSYVVPEEGSPYVILFNTPCDARYATK